MGLPGLMLSGRIAVGLVLAGITDDLGGVRAVFYSAAVIFSGLSLTSGYLYISIRDLTTLLAPLTTPKASRSRETQGIATLNRNKCSR
jgi:hypothetical protein